MLAELRAAIAAGDFGGALAIALAWWRETRAVELADLVDVLGTRCTLPVPPRREVHAWWMLNATTYNPVAVTALAATASDRAARSERKWPEVRAWLAGNPVLARIVEPHAAYLEDKPHMMAESNRLERLAVMAIWPDDPRTARVLAGWLAEGTVAWAFELAPATRAYYDVLAERLIALGDVRVDELLASTVVEPRGKTKEVRALQQEAARRVIAGLHGRAGTLDPSALDPSALDPEALEQLASWRTTVAPALAPRDAVEEDALWDEVQQAPEDLGPRMVLADFLLEHGDPRGQLIVAQCSPKSQLLEVRALVEQHWSTWLGDLALVLDPGGSEFHHGMLEIVRVGQSTTPEWAYARLRGHRELACVHTVRPSYGVPAAAFVAFLLELERQPHAIGISHAIVELLGARAPWPFRKLEFDHRRVRGYRDPPVEVTLELAARAMPEVEEVWIRTRPPAVTAFCACVPQLPTWFPKLARVAIEARDWKWEATSRAQLAVPPRPPG